VIPAIATYEGAGFLVHRPFPTRSLSFVDPFLLLDEMGPSDQGPGEAQGAPDHPHRGFETVTYMIDGEMEHRDSAGHAGKIGPGDVQWMTAGGGVIHSEMPSAAFQEKGGRMHGFQLWVNLPKRDKMMKPRYQELPASKIPVGEAEGVRVRVIAGESLGAKAAIDTRTPIFYLHATMKKGASLEQPAGKDFRVMAYVVDGEVRIGGRGRKASAHELVVFEGEGDVRVEADQPSNVLLLGGVPIGEPVARYGPFVMNTEEEIRQAVRDFQAGSFTQA
jgi:hypothetical protein